MAGPFLRIPVDGFRLLLRKLPRPGRAWAEGEGEMRGKLNRNRPGTLETDEQEAPSQRVALESKMDSSFLKEQADRCRSLAENADPFIKRRLLDLAARYDARSELLSRTPRTFGIPGSLLEAQMQGQRDADA